MEQNKKIKRVAIVGVGLIGGSFALTLKEKGIAEEVIGVDNSENNRNKALELKLVDRFEELHQAVKEADLIVLATPVDSIPMLAVKALNLVNEKQVVIDVGYRIQRTGGGQTWRFHRAYRCDLRPRTE